MRLRFLGLVPALSILATGSAVAQSAADLDDAPPYVQGPSEDEYRDLSYGFQIFAADVLSVAAITFSDPNGSSSVGSAGAAGMVLGAPLIHAAHDNWGRAGVSLLARVAIPLTAGALAGGFCTREDRVYDGNDECVDKILLGVSMGLGAAALLDYLVLSKKTVRMESRRGLASIQPTVQWGGSGAQAGLGLRF